MNEALPRREAVLELLESRGRPLTVREMAVRLGVSARALTGFSRYVESLAQEGELALIPPERFALPGPEAPPSRRGRRSIEGIFEVDERWGPLVHGEGLTLRVAEGREGGAQRGDRVLVQPGAEGPLGVEGEVLRVIEGAAQRVAGTLRRRGSSAWIEPDDPRWRGPVVLQGELSGRDGEGAVAQISRRAELAGEHHEARLIAALGAGGSLLLEEDKLLLREEIALEFEGDLAGAAGGPVAGALADRTAVPLLAVDPGDGEPELAFWAEGAVGGGVTVWLALADAAGEVEGPLDEAARRRCRTVRLPQRTAWMLPRAVVERCSLRPGEERPALCLVVELGPEGEALSRRIERARVKAHGLVSASGAARSLGWAEDVGRPPPGHPLDDALVPGLSRAMAAAERLRERRIEGGAVELPGPRLRAVLRGGELRRIERVDGTGEGRAAQALEELALLADDVASRHLADRGLLAIYRAQRAPGDEALGAFARCCEGLGFPVDAGDAAAFAAQIRRLEQLAQRDALAALLERSVEAPTYDASGRDHWGLAARMRAPVASPLHRYADLVNLRLLTRSLRAEAAGEVLAQGREEERWLLALAAELAQRDARARRAEREALDVYRAAMARERVGGELDAQVIALSPAGARVLLEDPPVEALLRPLAMGRDSYALADDRPAFVAKKSGDSVALGDVIGVRVDDASLPRRLAFVSRLLPETPAQATPKARQASPKARQAHRAPGDKKHATGAARRR